MMNNQVLNNQEKCSIIQVNREDIKRRHDLLMAELQQLREWLGYRPIPTRAHQRELIEISQR